MEVAVEIARPRTGASDVEDEEAVISSEAAISSSAGAPGFVVEPETGARKWTWPLQWGQTTYPYSMSPNAALDPRSCGR